MLFGIYSCHFIRESLIFLFIEILYYYLALKMITLLTYLFVVGVFASDLVVMNPQALAEEFPEEGGMHRI